MNLSTTIFFIIEIEARMAIDGTECVEYGQYIVITVSGDCDYIYFYNKDLQYITHSYTNNWDWGSGTGLDVDARHGGAKVMAKEWTGTIPV